MKKFEKPVLEVEAFDMIDVITASGSCEWHCDDDGFNCPNVTSGN